MNERVSAKTIRTILETEMRAKPQNRAWRCRAVTEDRSNPQRNGMAMNLTTQVREIAKVTTAVAKGDLSKKIGVEVKGEFLELKNTINQMVDRLGTFAAEVSKVAREVGTTIANGDMSQKIDVEASGEIQVLKVTINNMVERLSSFCYEMQKVAKDVGLDGKMGAQADIEGLSGRWKEIGMDVNTMASNLVREIRQPGRVYLSLLCI